MKKYKNNLCDKYQNNASLFTTISAIFITYGLIITFFIVSILVFATGSIVNSGVKVLNQELIELSEYFETKDYEKIDQTDVMGVNFYYTVFDKDGNVDYTSNQEFCIDYSLVPLIPKEAYNFNITTTIYKQQDKLDIYNVQFSALKGDYKGYMIVAEKTLDDNYNILSSSNPLVQGSYTQRQFNMLCGHYEDDYKVGSIKINSESGESSTVVLFVNENQFEQIADKISGIQQTITVLIICIVFILLMLFLYTLTRKLKKHINKLNNQIVNFTNTGKVDYDQEDFNGPREFAEIYESFNTMATSITKKENEKQQLMADISHDLKTPITVIKGFSEILVKKPRIAVKERNSYLESINNNAIKLNNLINDLAHYNTYNLKEFQTSLKKVNINKYITNYFKQIKSMLKMKNFTLKIKNNIKDCYILMDKIIFDKVFDNFISNTIKFNPNGCDIVISTSLDSENKNIIIDYIDYGVGIDKTIQEKIFDPLVVGDKSRTLIKGSGLGLSIVKKVVELHNSNVQFVTDNKTNVAHFRIIMPIFE